MRLSFLGIAAFLLLSAPAGAQVADEIDNEGETEQTDDGFDVTAGHVNDRHLTSSAGPRDGRTIRCEFWEVQGGSFHDVDPFPVVPREGALYELRCFEGDMMLPPYPVFVLYDPDDVPDPAVTTDEITLFAYRSMTFEAPAPAINPVADQIVGIPTWLAVTSQLDYAEVSAAAGPVWAAVRPQLRDATFTMPNGDTVTCDRDSDITLVWNPDGSDSQSTDCSYTFTSNGDNPDGEPVHTEIVATVTWELFRRTNLQATEQFWAVHTETTVIPVTVRELQAVID